MCSSIQLNWISRECRCLPQLPLMQSSEAPVSFFFFHMVASYLLHSEYILYICKRKNLPIGPNPCAAKQRKKKKTRKIHRFIIDSNAYLLLNIANGDLLDIPLAELIYNGKEIKEYLLHCSRKLGLASKRRNRRKKISCKVEELKELWCKLM